MSLLFINLGDFETTAQNSYCREVLAAFKPHLEKIHVLCRDKKRTIHDENVSFHCSSLFEWAATVFSLRKEIDAVHAQDLFVGGFFAALMSLLLRVPLTVRCGGVWRYKLASPAALFKQMLARMLEQIVLLRATKVVFNSKDTREVYSLARHKSVVVYNGVDTKRFSPGPSESDTGITRLIFVGRVVLEKGLRELAQALEEVEGYSLTVVGNGPLLADLKEDHPEIEFRGRVPHEQLGALIAGYHALILPSYSEGFPNVVLEGMACGLPVLVSDIPGTHEMLSDKEGVFFEPRSKQAIIQALQEFKTRDRKSMGRRARACVEKRFDRQAQADRLYSQLFRGQVVIFWDYELQQGIDRSMGDIQRSGFDEHEQTDRILDLHKRYGVPGVFSTVGVVAQEGGLPYHSREQVQRIVSEGHELASHTQRHELLCELDETGVRETLKSSKQELEDASGVDVTTFVPPHNMPFECFGVSVYHKDGWHLSPISSHRLRELVAECEYTCMRQYRIRPFSRLLAHPDVRVPVSGPVNTLYMSSAAGFGEDARKAALQAVRKRRVAVISGHPHATLDQGPQNLSRFKEFLAFIEELGDDVEVVRAGDVS